MEGDVFDEIEIKTDEYSKLEITRDIDKNEIPDWNTLYKYWSIKGSTNYIISVLSTILVLCLIQLSVIVITIVKWNELLFYKIDEYTPITNFIVPYDLSTPVQIYVLINTIITFTYCLILIFSCVLNSIQYFRIDKFLYKKLNLTIDDIKTIKWKELIDTIAIYTKNADGNVLYSDSVVTITKDDNVMIELIKQNILSWGKLPYSKLSHLFFNMIPDRYPQVNKVKRILFVLEYFFKYWSYLLYQQW